MKKIYFLLFTLLIAAASFGQSVFINEIHYDDASTDSGEGVEIAGPAGTDLSTYTIIAYNGSATSGAPYSTTNLSGTIDDEGSGYGAVWFPIAGLQNGAPDGISLDNGGVLVQFLSYEGTFTGVGGPADSILSTDIGVSEGGTVEGSSLQLTGTGLTYNNFSWATEATATPGTINTGQTFGTPVPSLTLDGGPGNGGSFTGNPEDINAQISFTVTNFNLSNDAGGGVSDGSGDGFIKWNVIDNGDSSPVDSGSVFTANPDPTEYPINNLAVNKSYHFLSYLVDNSGNAISPLVIYEFDVFIPAYVDVADLATLRAQTIDPDTYYRVTGEVIVTYSRSNRNQKYLQDATGGVLVDDVNFEISTTYNVGDGITNIRGNLFDFNGILEFVPTPDDWGTPSSTGNSVSVPTVDIATLSSNWGDYESELVRVNGVTFADGNGSNTFSSSTIYSISDGASMNFRTTFFEADYITQTIPVGSTNIVGIIGEISGVPYITARSMAELTLSSKDKQIDGFAMYPNPTSYGYVNISSKSQTAMNIGVYDILGKQVINQTVKNNRLDVSNLTTGIYIMKISQDDATTTKKLIIN